MDNFFNQPWKKIFFFGQRHAANFLNLDADAKNNILFIILDLIN